MNLRKPVCPALEPRRPSATAAGHLSCGQEWRPSPAAFSGQGEKRVPANMRDPAARASRPWQRGPMRQAGPPLGESARAPGVPPGARELGAGPALPVPGACGPPRPELGQQPCGARGPNSASPSLLAGLGLQVASTPPPPSTPEPRWNQLFWEQPCTWRHRRSLLWTSQTLPDISLWKCNLTTHNDPLTVSPSSLRPGSPVPRDQPASAVPGAACPQKLISPTWAGLLTFLSILEFRTTSSLSSYKWRCLLPVNTAATSPGKSRSWL